MKKTLLFVASILAASAMSVSAQRANQNQVIKVDVPFAQSMSTNKAQFLSKLNIGQPTLKNRAEDDDTRQYLQTFSEKAGLGASIFSYTANEHVFTVNSAFADILCSRLAGNKVEGAYIICPAQIKTVKLVARNMRGDVIASSKTYTVEEALELNDKTAAEAGVTVDSKGTIGGYNFILPYEQAFEVPVTGFVAGFEVELDINKSYKYTDQNGKTYDTVVYFGMSPSFFSSVNLMSMDGSEYEDVSSDLGAAYVIPYTSGNAKFADNDVSLMYMNSGRVEAEGDMDYQIGFINLGNNEVDKLTIKYQRGDGTEESFDLKTRFQYYDQNNTLQSVKVPYGTIAYTELGDFYDEEIPAGTFYPTVTVEGINGEEDGFNADNGNAIQGRVISISEPQEMKVLAEKATGTWCGWCPRGIVGVEYLEKTFGDQVIPVELHYADDFDPYTDQQGSPLDKDAFMNSFSYLANYVAGNGAGFPSLSLNRMTFVDPYYGSSVDEEYGIKYDVEDILKIPSEATLAIKSQQSSEKTLDVQADARFYVAGSGSNYVLGFAIVEDDLKGAQKNSYNEVTPAQYKKAYGHDASAELAEWIGNAATMAVTYKGVARQYYSLAGIKGSIEGWISGGGQVKTYKTQLDLPATIRNTENCHLIAMLYDALTGEVIQAQTCKLDGGEVGYEGVNTVLRDGVEMAKISAEAGVVNVEGEGIADVYTFDGKLVRSQAVNGNAAISLPAGNYVVRIKNGNEVTSKKVAL